MEQQDFDQVNDLELTPTVTTGLLYFESDEPTINSRGFSGGIPFYSKTTNFEAFNKEFVAENLLEGVLIYEISNTTSKELELDLEFLGDGGNTLHTESFLLLPHPSALLTREVTYGPGGLDLALLTATGSLRFTVVNWGDDSSISPVEDPKIIVKVAGEFIFQLQ